MGGRTELVSPRPPHDVWTDSLQHVTILCPSRVQRDGLFGFLTAVVAVALARGVVGADSTGGRVAITIVFGGLLVLILVGWIRLVRRADRLEVSAESVRYISGSGKETHIIIRADGPDLRFVARGAGRFSFLALQQAATGALIPLHLFARRPVTAACEQSGWRMLG